MEGLYSRYYTNTHMQLLFESDNLQSTTPFDRCLKLLIL